MEFRGPAWLIKGTITAGTIATVASLILLYMDVSGRLTAWSKDIIVWTDTGLCFVMLAEWFLLLALVDDKRAFAKTRWIDLLASIPLLLILRPLRLVRLIRLLRLMRGVALFCKALRPWNQALRSSVFKSAAVVAVVLIVVGSLAITDLERENANLDEFREALWWAVVTTTTVGYGDAVPVTDEGRSVAVVLMILGIGLFGTFAASLTAALTAQPEITNQDLLERIASLEATLTSLMTRK